MKNKQGKTNGFLLSMQVGMVAMIAVCLISSVVQEVYGGDIFLKGFLLALAIPIVWLVGAFSVMALQAAFHAAVTPSAEEFWRKEHPEWTKEEIRDKVSSDRAATKAHEEKEAEKKNAAFYAYYVEQKRKGKW